MVIKHLKHMFFLGITTLFVTSCMTGFDSLKDIPIEDISFKTVSLSDNYDKLQEGAQDYHVGAGDNVKIEIYNDPMDSTRITELGEIIGHQVDEQGFINVALLKQVKVVGMTVREISVMLEDKYMHYIKNPHVMFEVVKFNSQFYYIAGAVEHPGKFPIKINTSLMEALATLTPFVKTSSISTVYMKRGDTVIQVSLADASKGVRNYKDLFLQNGDTFYVPPPAASRAYILGEVQRPGAYEIQSDTYSLIDLLSDAGGKKAETASGFIYIVRDYGDKTMMAKCRFKDLFKGKVTNILLMPGDRVFLSATPLESYNRVVRQLLPTFQILSMGASFSKDVK